MVGQARQRLISLPAFFIIIVTGAIRVSRQQLKRGGEGCKYLKNNGCVKSLDVDNTPALMISQSSAQLSFCRPRFIKTNWPNDESPRCTVISSAPATVIGSVRVLGEWGGGVGLKGQQEKEVTIPNKEGGSKFPAYKYIMLMPENNVKLCDASVNVELGVGRGRRWGARRRGAGGGSALSSGLLGGNQ